MSQPPRCRTSGPSPRRAVALLAALLTLVLLTGIAGCGGRTEALRRIRESGLLRVAVDPAFPPFESVDGEGRIVGFDADLAAELASGLGVDVHFVTTGYDALYDALTVGRADIIISALYPDPSRTAGFAFSRPYFNAGDVLVVPAGSGISNSADLAGATVGCVFGTTGHMAALEWEAALAPAPTVITADTPLTLTTLLQAGTADAVVVDHVSARMAVGDDPAFRILWPPITDEPYVIATRQEDGALMAELEEILADLDAAGTLDTLVQRWMHP